MTTTTHSRSILNDLSIISTLVDAARALSRGERWSAAFLMAAAALSRKVPGLGAIASLVVRLVRRLR